MSLLYFGLIKDLLPNYVFRNEKIKKLKDQYYVSKQYN